MKNFKQLLPFISEIYFIMFACWWGINTYFYVLPILNYYAVILAGLLLVLIYFQNRNLGMILSSILGMVSMYLILALLSDFYKFPANDSKGIRFLLTGGLLIAANITMAIIMFRKYYRRSRPVEFSISL